MILPPGPIGALRALLVGPRFSRLPKCGLLRGIEEPSATGAEEVWTSISLSEKVCSICMKDSHLRGHHLPTKSFHMAN
jgi:hypothetical protein